MPTRDRLYLRVSTAAQAARDTARRIRASRGKYGQANLYGTRWLDKRRRVADPETGPLVLAMFQRGAGARYGHPRLRSDPLTSTRGGDSKVGTV